MGTDLFSTMSKVWRSRTVHGADSCDSTTIKTPCIRLWSQVGERDIQKVAVCDASYMTVWRSEHLVCKVTAVHERIA